MLYQSFLSISDFRACRSIFSVTFIIIKVQYFWKENLSLHLLFFMTEFTSALLSLLQVCVVCMCSASSSLNSKICSWFVEFYFLVASSDWNWWLYICNLPASLTVICIFSNMRAVNLETLYQFSPQSKHETLPVVPGLIMWCCVSGTFIKHFSTFQEMWNYNKMNKHE